MSKKPHPSLITAATLLILLSGCGRSTPPNAFPMESEGNHGKESPATKGSVAPSITGEKSIASARGKPAIEGSPPSPRVEIPTKSVEIDAVVRKEIDAEVKEELARSGGGTLTSGVVSREAAVFGSDDELLAKAVDNLRKGNLAYSTPTKMETGQTEHVTAKIAGSMLSAADLAATVTKEPGHDIATATTPISPKMKMTLKSADFDITPLSSDEQSVGGTNPTTWEWDIIAKHSGKLHLHLAAIVEVKTLSKDFTSIDRDIEVRVDPLDATTVFVKTNWQWIIATLTALGGTLWKLLKDRRSRTGRAA